LLLTDAIVAEDRVARFACNVFLADERNIVVAGDREEQAEADLFLCASGARLNAFDDGAPVAGVRAVNHPRHFR
jgi:hypothetical protein